MTVFHKPDSEKPYAEVKQISRHAWSVTICTGWCMTYGPDGHPWYRSTEARAKRKGEKELAKYNRKFGNLSAGFSIQ